MSRCNYLQEIRGIPLKLEFFSAVNCGSLASWDTSMLLNQELHDEAGNTAFYFPGTSIPKWFEHQCNRLSISFWFRNKFPTITLGFATSSSYITRFSVNVSINNRLGPYQYTCNGTKVLPVVSRMSHIFISNQIRPQDKRFQDYLDEAFIENEWNYVSIIDVHKQVKSVGIHVIKNKTCMEDIRFTDPYQQ